MGGKQNQKRTILWVVLGVIAAGVAILFSVGPIRKAMADGRAQAFAKETGIRTVYMISSEPETFEDALRELYRMAAWADRVISDIDKAFDRKYDRKTYQEREDPGAFAPEEKLDRYAMEKRWMSMRNAVSRSLRSAAGLVLEPYSDLTPLRAEDFSTCCFYNEAFRVVYTVDHLDQGDALNAYECASIDSSLRNWENVPMDIGYGLYPELMITGCEEELDQSMKGELAVLEDKLAEAHRFQYRYGVTVPNYEKASELCYSRKMEANQPSGNHVSGGNHSSSRNRSSTGTTSPARKNSSSGSSSAGGTRRHSSSSGSSSFDPDDHDIEGYYEDNRDEYDDYDDAYDGFLDDEDAWEDY